MTLTTARLKLSSLSSYDRMLPQQTQVTVDGFGNLIALPWESSSIKKETTLFVDDSFKPYINQLEVLHSVKRVSESQIQFLLSFCNNNALGSLNAVNDCDVEQVCISKPWEDEIQLNKSDVVQPLNIIISDKIYICESDLSPRAYNYISRLASFKNPTFYQKLRANAYIKNINRIISCFDVRNGYLCLPRGCFDILKEFMQTQEIEFNIEDKRFVGNKINTKFVGNLRDNQEKGVHVLTKHNYGVLVAATGYGKTIVGIYLIAKYNVNTLILVHNNEIMKRWQKEIPMFLKVDNEPATVGSMGFGKNTLNGVIDIVSIKSITTDEEKLKLIKNYGMVLIDECHHFAAQSFLEVISTLNAKRIYGFTATPKRQDQQEKKYFFQLGPIRYEYTAKERAISLGMTYSVFPRFTRYVSVDKGNNPSVEVVEIVKDAERNNLIIKDIIRSIEAGRTPFVLTKIKEHAEYIVSQLKGMYKNVYYLRGGYKSKEQIQQLEEMYEINPSEPLVLVAIASAAGEGFDLKRLDTLFMTVPFAWEGSVAQYVGRLHREYENKQDLIIYDYVDLYVPMLERMYAKRLRTYKKLGYSVYTPNKEDRHGVQIIHDAASYFEELSNDIKNAKYEIIISSTKMSKKRIENLLDILITPMNRGCKVSIITQRKDAYKTTMKSNISRLYKNITSKGIALSTIDTELNQFVVIDREVLWYGDVMFLTDEKKDSVVLRIADKVTAKDMVVYSETLDKTLLK
ncbi:superfamily II DNA or RNA helicase [Breznakia blatticola]|uniref:Superfamily II DNA or RNA helicase n=2 Tax=Breznakia blatticola TaxID=1754012 RepID=A0A4R7ZJ52_9FIRM|nr:DEAD/DEAH box helicase family protein [Breznakia blatticola]TDW16471.1 superfamily II DNA or RNA helicase [Breznakia blatticola]